MDQKPKKKRYKAIVYEVVTEPNGTILLRPVTSASSLTVGQCAASMNVCLNNIYREIECGKLKARRIGAAIRVDVENFIDWRNETEIREYERGQGSRTLAERVRRAQD